MTGPPPSQPPARPSDAGGNSGPEFARAEALAGLAREVEGLRRTVDPLCAVQATVEAKVEDLARLVGQLTDAVTALSARPDPVPAPSWLLAPTDPSATEAMLAELCVWLHTIFLRYPDGVTALPECWLYHPHVVEELTWLMHAWCVAYQDTAASVQLAGDWHDRQRPGVVRRIRDSAGSCSIERHQTRPERDQFPAGAAPVPGHSAVPVLAGWWATRRDHPGPEPAGTPAHGLNGALHR